jgi:hypothetical protein
VGKKFFSPKNRLQNEKKKLSHRGPKEKVPWERVGIFLPHPVIRFCEYLGCLRESCLWGLELKCLMVF